MMPKMDGVEAVKIIRSMGYKRDIIALTANALIGQEEMFLQNGFDGFISKPIDSRELNHCLNEFIRNKQPQDVIDKARKEQKEKGQEYTENTNGSNLEKVFLRDAQNAVNVLENLYNNFSSAEDAVNFSAEETKLYITIIHGIKSALANIGQIRLSDAASKLEKAGKEANAQIILTETPAFIDSIKSLIKKITPEEKTNNAEISGTDALFIKEKLLNIKTLCGEMDKKAAKKELNEINQRPLPDYIKAHIDSITAHLLHSDFDNAAQAAQQAADSIAS